MTIDTEPSFLMNIFRSSYSIENTGSFSTSMPYAASVSFIIGSSKLSNVLIDLSPGIYLLRSKK